MRLTFAMKFVAVLLTGAVSLTALGGGVAWAASDSLPGDTLYPVKLTAEDARLAFASAPGNQVGLALQFAEERVEEIQALAAAGRRVPDETIARMEQHAERALTQAARASSDEEMIGLLTQIAERVRVQAQMLEQVQAMAPQQAQARLEHAVRVCRQVSENAEGGLSDPSTFRWQHRQEQETEPPGEAGEMTPASEGDQGQEQPQYRNTPVGTPHATPYGPRTTPVLQGTPHGPQGTPVHSGTPQQPDSPGKHSGGDD